MIKWVARSLAILFAYRAGKKDEQLKVAKKLLKDRDRSDEIQESNARKSSKSIIDSLRKQYGRSE